MTSFAISRYAAHLPPRQRDAFVWKAYKGCPIRAADFACGKLRQMARDEGTVPAP